MTVTPGSLDYLYYNGVLDHIPYEAYEMGPVVPGSQQTGLKGFPPLGQLKQSVMGDNTYNNITTQNTSKSDYLNSAMKGEMYGYYGNSNDSFTRSTNSGINQSGNYSKLSQMSGAGYGYGGSYNSMNGMSSANGYSYPGAAQSMNGYDTATQGENYPKYSLFNNRGYGNQQTNYASRKRNRSGFGDAILKLLAITGAITGSILLITKLKNKPAQTTTTAWQDIKNWVNNSKFLSKLNPKNWFKNHPNFWSKLNPKNWFKKSTNNTKSSGSFWSKLNPKNWFKKNPSTQNQTKTSFWSKLNPKNWFKKNKGGNIPPNTSGSSANSASSTVNGGNLPAKSTNEPTKALVLFDPSKKKTGK